MIHLLQKKIEDIYRLQIFTQASNYVLSPIEFRKFSKTLGNKPQVIFQDQNDDASIGIYLGTKIFKNIRKKTKIFSLQDFCVMTEEVSHFIYLIWSKCNEKKINLLDLEIQAEIDKFVLATEFFHRESMLFDKLFENFSIRSDIQGEEKERYLTANRLGRKLVFDWKQKKISKKKKFDWLRFFYRQSPSSRISMIERGLH